MLENEGYKKHLMEHLVKMGYQVTEHYNPVDNSILMLQNKQDQFIGNIDINSNISLYSAFAGEQEKIAKTISFSEMFYDKGYNAHGSVNIMGHNNMNLCAKLDEQTGDTYYLVLPDNPTNEELGNPITYQNIDNAKRTFAVESGLMDNVYYSADYQQALKNKLVDQEVLLSQLLSMLKEQRARIEYSISLFDVSKTVQKAEQLRQNVLSYQEKIANSNMKLSGLFEMLIKQELSEVEYFQKQEVAREQKKRDTSQFMRFTMELNLLKEQLIAFESAKKYLQDNPLGKALTKDMVDKWIGRIFVSSEKGIKIEYLFKDYHALQVTV